MEQRLALSEFQMNGIDTEKARDAKLELTVRLNNWWTEEDLSCLVGWWLERISLRYGGNNECLALKPSSPILNWILSLIRSQWTQLWFCVCQEISEAPLLTFLLSSQVICPQLTINIQLHAHMLDAWICLANQTPTISNWCVLSVNFLHLWTVCTYLCSICVSHWFSWWFLLIRN